MDATTRLIIGVVLCATGFLLVRLDVTRRFFEMNRACNLDELDRIWKQSIGLTWTRAAGILMAAAVILSVRSVLVALVIAIILIVSELVGIRTQFAQKRLVVTRAIRDRR